MDGSPLHGCWVDRWVGVWTDGWMGDGGMDSVNRTDWEN